MVVYVLVISSACDGDQQLDTMVYDSFDKANKKMLEQIELARKDFEGQQTEEDDYCEGDMSWSIWQDGEYCMNHFSVEIYQRQVL